ncbi:hypothetical protein PAPHI01_0772 [Pancytospora philotis]|nr:hypothetical protein PAPHI01_0772 [Pancytospora philotis]
MAEEFDATEFINKVYKESTLYELNDTLGILAESIAKTQQDRKRLVTTHFSKFVQCREVLEEMWRDVQEKGLDRLSRDRIEQSLARLEAKYTSITQDIADDIDVQKCDSRRLQYENEFAEIFTLKDELEKHRSSPEQFAAAYLKARKAFERVKGSKYMQQRFKEVEPHVATFLNEVYGMIADEGIPFEETCHYFDLYFDVSGGGSDQRIRSTLLVGFKDATTGFAGAGAEFVDYLFVSFARVIKRVDETIAVEAIRHFYEQLRRALRDASLCCMKLLLPRIRDSAEAFGLEGEARRSYMLAYSEYKLAAFGALIKDRGVDEAVAAYDGLSELLDSQDILAARDQLLDYAVEYAKGKTAHSYEYLKAEAQEISKLRRCLGGASSAHNKKLSASLREQRHGVIEAIVESLGKVLESGNHAHILVEFTRVMDRSPEFCGEIIFELKNQIVKDAVVHAFLWRFVKLDPPALSASEKERFDRLKDQFDYLLEPAHSKK